MDPTKCWEELLALVREADAESPLHNVGAHMYDIRDRVLALEEQRKKGGCAPAGFSLGLPGVVQDEPEREQWEFKHVMLDSVAMLAQLSEWGQRGWSVANLDNDGSHYVALLQRRKV